MAVHQIEPAPESTVDVFSADHEPLLEIDSGDTIVVRSLDAAGYLERQQFPGDTERPTMFAAVPTIFTAINGYKGIDKYDLSSIKICISGQFQ